MMNVGKDISAGNSSSQLSQMSLDRQVMKSLPPSLKSSCTNLAGQGNSDQTGENQNGNNDVQTEVVAVVPNSLHSEDLGEDAVIIRRSGKDEEPLVGNSVAAVSQELAASEEMVQLESQQSHVEQVKLQQNLRQQAQLKQLLELQERIRKNTPPPGLGDQDDGGLVFGDRDVPVASALKDVMSPVTGTTAKGSNGRSYGVPPGLGLEAVDAQQAQGLADMQRLLVGTSFGSDLSGNDDTGNFGFATLPSEELLSNFGGPNSAGSLRANAHFSTPAKVGSNVRGMEQRCSLASETDGLFPESTELESGEVEGQDGQKRTLSRSQKRAARRKERKRQLIAAGIIPGPGGVYKNVQPNQLHPLTGLPLSHPAHAALLAQVAGLQPGSQHGLGSQQDSVGMPGSQVSGTPYSAAVGMLQHSPPGSGLVPQSGSFGAATPTAASVGGIPHRLAVPAGASASGLAVTGEQLTLGASFGSSVGGYPDHATTAHSTAGSFAGNNYGQTPNNYAASLGERTISAQQAWSTSLEPKTRISSTNPVGLNPSFSTPARAQPQAGAHGTTMMGHHTQHVATGGITGAKNNTTTYSTTALGNGTTTNSTTTGSMASMPMSDCMHTHTHPGHRSFGAVHDMLGQQNQAGFSNHGYPGAHFTQSVSTPGSSSSYYGTHGGRAQQTAMTAAQSLHARSFGGYTNTQHTQHNSPTGTPQKHHTPSVHNAKGGLNHHPLSLNGYVVPKMGNLDGSRTPVPAKAGGRRFAAHHAYAAQEHTRMDVTRPNVPLSPRNPNAIIIVHNLKENVTRPQHLAALFSGFGNVERVKILFNKRTAAMVQMSDPVQARCAVQTLNGCVLFGNKLEVDISRCNVVPIPKDEDQDVLTLDFNHLPLYNRFPSFVRPAVRSFGVDPATGRELTEYDPSNRAHRNHPGVQNAPMHLVGHLAMTGQNTRPYCVDDEVVESVTLYPPGARCAIEGLPAGTTEQSLVAPPASVLDGRRVQEKGLVALDPEAAELDPVEGKHSTANCRCQGLLSQFEVKNLQLGPVVDGVRSASVEFATVQNATDALASLHGLTMPGGKILAMGFSA